MKVPGDDHNCLSEVLAVPAVTVCRPFVTIMNPRSNVTSMILLQLSTSRTPFPRNDHEAVVERDDDELAPGVDEEDGSQTGGGLQ